MWKWGLSSETLDTEPTTLRTGERNVTAQTGI